MSRILLVDDDDSARLTLGALLELEGHAVVEADSLAAAVTQLGSEPFAVVIVDWHLGRDDGLQLVPHTRGAKVLLLTGASEEAPRPPGVAAVVRKGDSFEDLKRLL
ncbi:MAG: response regulator [Deltaproteobacteria bacterium]|nr:response regulator [Deltaproteobacteria bacterium]